jgi:hypothetical protein
MTGFSEMNAELGVDGSDFLGFPEVLPRSRHLAPEQRS